MFDIFFFRHIFVCSFYIPVKLNNIATKNVVNVFKYRIEMFLKKNLCKNIFHVSYNGVTIVHNAVVRYMIGVVIRVDVIYANVARRSKAKLKRGSLL